MQFQVKKLNQSQSQLLQKQRTYSRSNYNDFVLENWDFKDQVFTCKCGCLDSCHRLAIEDCMFCEKCLKFENCVVELKIIIYEKIGELNEYKGTIF